MRIDRRLVLIGVLLVVLSMTMATQYATTKIGYSYSVVHPSEAEIRFIASDFSDDSIRVLRVNGTNASGDMDLKIRLGGNLSAGQNKTYTAAFGIVNEENFKVNISYINVSTTSPVGADYMKIWVHGDRDAIAENDATSVLIWNKASMGFTATSSVWLLGAGNNNANNMNADGSTELTTPWDSTANVRYSVNDANNSVNGTSDFVWIQISLDIPTNAATTGHWGTIYIHTRASPD